MNKRILELAEQAGFDIEVEDIFNYKPQHSFIGSDENMKKFAELIVLECLQTCKDVGIESKEVWNASKDYQEGRQMGAEVCHNMIKKHFGVE